MSVDSATRRAPARDIFSFLATAVVILVCLDLSGCGSNPTQPPSPPSRVMVTGGFNPGERTSRREIYFFDSRSGSFEEPPHLMSEGRACHSATLVNAATSFVLVTGGDDSNAHASRTAEAIFLDGTNQVLASMQMARTQQTATRLLDGRVLITGGKNFSGNTEFILGSAELFDNGAFTFTGNDMVSARFGHTATPIEDGPAKGKVLIAGGVGAGNIAEIFDPATSTFTRTTTLGGTDMTFPRAEHTATWLGGINQVLILGGGDPRTRHQATAQAELFDPATNTFMRIADMRVARFEHTATNIGLNVVLITGGLDSSGNRHVIAELFNPVQRSFATTAHPMTKPRANHSAVLLTSGPFAGQVLVVGGAAAVADAELYDPTQESFMAVPPLQGEFGTFCQTATLLP